MTEPLIDPAFALGLRAALAFILIAAAAHKMGDPARFREVLLGYGLVPQGLMRGAPLGIAFIELTIGIGLLIFPMSFVAAVSAGALLAAYGAVMALTILRGRAGLDCGCGARNQPIGWPLVARNVVLMGIANFAATPATVFGLHWLTYGTAGFVAVVAAVTYASLDVLLANRAALLMRRAHA